MLDLIGSGYWPPSVVIVVLAVMVVHAAATVYAVWCWREDVLYKRSCKAERRRRATVKAAERMRSAQADVKPVRKKVVLPKNELMRSKAHLN